MISVPHKDPEDVVYDAVDRAIRGGVSPTALVKVIDAIVEDRVAPPVRQFGTAVLPANNNPLEFPRTLAEEALDYELSGHIEKTIFAGVNLKSRDGLVEFDYSDIKQFYGKLRWKQSANMSDVLNRAASKLYIAPAGEDNETGRQLWHVTQTGYKHLMTLRKETNND